MNEKGLEGEVLVARRAKGMVVTQARERKSGVIDGRKRKDRKL